MLPDTAKNDFAGIIKLRILKWGDYPGVPGCTLSVIIVSLEEVGREI